uniref:Uncharacterized protein n=1 Tax=Glossina brevipalpis TaxID=37001 RepID=A0A1A9W9C3_9MUSC
MVRQRQRKSIEELYGSKYDASKSQVTNNVSKNPRTDRDYGYIITSSTPYNTGGPVPIINANSNIGGNGATSTARRKSARPSVKGAEKYYSKDEKIINLDDLKKDHNMKSKTLRAEKFPYTTSTNMHDNKICGSVYTDRHKESGGEAGGSHQHSHQHQQQQHPHQHQHQHHHHNHNHRTASRDDDKDDDTEEFFELIRQTVESAIGKSISDLLNRNFRELATKIERFSSELKNTNALLNKLQTDLNNKVVHYGEETSRHFRYLCMKSEYDKMFYQHQSMIAAVTSSATSHPVDKRNCGGKASASNNIVGATVADNDKTNASAPIPCTCRSNKSNATNEYNELAHKQSPGDHSLSQKSSEMDMREVLEHIQRFCTQMQLNDLKCDHLPTNAQSSMKRYNSRLRAISLKFFF